MFKGQKKIACEHDVGQRNPLSDLGTREMISEENCYLLFISHMYTACYPNGLKVKRKVKTETNLLFFCHYQVGVSE